MDASSAAISRLLALPRADCECLFPDSKQHLALDTNRSCSFAFVEYESRRDADDAYHEMHNKRIGRDDLLKIEVRWTQKRAQHNATQSDIV